MSLKITRFTIFGEIVEDQPALPDEKYLIKQTDEFAEWKRSLLDQRAIIRIEREIGKYARGVGTAEHKREGLHEIKVEYGPGYRLYFGKIGRCIILLIGGGIKKGQQADINEMTDQWEEIKREVTRL